MTENNLDKPVLCWEGKDSGYVRCSERLYQQELLEPLEQAQQFVDIRAKKKKEVCAYTYNSWHNRMMLGDSLSIMRSLLDNDNLGGKVQMIYFDPPYGISFKSGFSPFNTNNLGTKENIEAYRDVWKNGISSYLTYIRDRIILAHQLLDDTGSIFVQISDENIDYIKTLLGDVFGRENFVSLIAYASTSGFESGSLSRAGDYIIWYAKDKTKLKYHALYLKKEFKNEGGSLYSKIEFEDGTRISIAQWEKETGNTFSFENIQKGARIYGLDNLISQGASSKPQPFVFEDKTYYPKQGSHWKASYPKGMERLKNVKRIDVSDKNIGYVRYFDDFCYVQINNIWKDTFGPGQYGHSGKIYSVQTSKLVIQRCLLMSTDPGDLVLDISCGSGTTAYVAEQWGRRWLTCDTSSVALALAKQRLMTATFDYYVLADLEHGLNKGFIYKKAQHITLGSIANGEEPPYETLYDQPEIDKTKVRVSGNFSYETMQTDTYDNLYTEQYINDKELMLSHLQTCGIVANKGKRIRFKEIRSSDKRYACAFGTTTNDKTCAFYFGAHDERISLSTVANAVEETPQDIDMLFIVGFAFASDVAYGKSNIATKLNILLVHTNEDIFMQELKHDKNTQAFFLEGTPLYALDTKDDRVCIRMCGYDYYDPASDTIKTYGIERIASWSYDNAYDGKTYKPKQTFYLYKNKKPCWYPVEKALKTCLNKDVSDQYNDGTCAYYTPDTQQYNLELRISDIRGIETAVGYTIYT